MTVRVLVLIGMLLLPAFQSVPPHPRDAAKPASVSTLVKAVEIPWKSFALANGLRVVVHTDRKAPIVAVSVWYNVGSKMEPVGKTGFAHLFEHLMFVGSENAPGEYSDHLKRLGAVDSNGNTDFDRTAYYETVPTSALPSALFLEADRMGHLLGARTEHLLNAQRAVVRNEKRQGDDRPFGQLRYKQVEGLFPPNHPYGHPTIGAISDLEGASLSDVKAWFTDHYAPNNAVLVLAGDIDVVTARPLVERYFGGIARGKATALPIVAIPTLSVDKSETVSDRVPNARLVRMWAVPGADDPDMGALDVAASALGGLTTARLYQKLVKDEMIATSVQASNQSFAQAGIFQIIIDIKPRVEPALVRRRVDEIVGEFLGKGLSADEVRRIATYYAVRRIEGLDRVGGPGGKAAVLAQGALFSNDPDRYKNDLAQLAAETPEHVLAVARKWLRRPAYTLTMVPGPRAISEEPVEKASDRSAPQETKTASIDPGKPEAIRFPAVERARLSNGIPIVYAQRAAIPMTRAMLVVDAGRAVDPPGKHGLTDFVATMLDEGVPGLDATAIGIARERLGLSLTLSANIDITFVSFSMPSANLAPALDLVGAMVRTPSFPPSEIERVRGELLAEAVGRRSDPATLADVTMAPLLYGTHPYSRGGGAADPAALRTMTRDDLVAYQQAWLRPDKASIYVVSDRTLAEVVPILEKRLGDWRSAAVQAGAKKFVAVPATVSPQIVLIDRPGAAQSVILGAAPTGLKGSDDIISHSLANNVLGGDFVSRLNMDLRERRHWSYGVRSYFDRNMMAMPFMIYAPVQADRTGPALAEIRSEISDFVADRPITMEEFERTIEGAVRGFAGGYETQQQVLTALLTLDKFGRPDDYYQTLSARYKSLTLEQLNGAARSAIRPDHFLWVIVGDAAKVRPQLEGIGLPIRSERDLR